MSALEKLRQAYIDHCTDSCSVPESIRISADMARQLLREFEAMEYDIQCLQQDIEYKKREIANLEDMKAM